MIRERELSRRGVRLITVAPLLAMLVACAHTERRTAAMQRVEAEWPVVPTQAWVSGHTLSVMVEGEHGLERYRARWKQHGLDEHGYRFRVAELEPADLTPEEDEKPSRARQVRVLEPDTWTRFTHTFGDRLAPTDPGTALLLQAGSSDTLVFRGADGTVRSALVRGAPTDLKVVRRLNLVELATEAARYIEVQTAGAGVSDAVFLFVVPRRERRNGLVLFDTSKHMCVAVELPRPSPDREGTAFTRAARMVSAVTIEAHGLALVKNPISSLGRLFNIFGQWIATWLTRTGPPTGGSTPPLAGAAPMRLDTWERELDERTGRHASRGAIRLLLDGENYFPVLEQRIRQSERSIAMRVNIFDDDDVAVQIADLLREQSRQVSVRVIMDEVSTLGAGNAAPAGAMPPGFVMPASMWRYLERGSNVAARAFLNPWMSSDHSKVFIFDNRYAHLGGMNIGREYRFEWHDMMVELEGPVVGRFAKEFERSWAHASALGDLAYAVAAVSARTEFAGDRERADYVDIRPLYTHTGDPQIYDAMMGAVSRARSYIWVENPYLYENSFVRALVEARRRGVDVRVVLPSDSDLGLGNSSNRVTANELIADGVRVYVYPGMTHVKAAIVDGWACLGSANFNKLSLRRNIETNIATAAPSFVGQLKRDLFELDFAVSSELSQPVAISGSDKFAEFVMDQF
jgi:cardiolipin synthase A/B